MLENFSAIILAAGLSGRMGFHKALLPYDEQRCFAQKIASDFRQIGCRNVVLVTNREAADSIKQHKVELDCVNVLVNNKPEWGRFYSLFLGFRAIESNQHVFVTNVDNPLVPVSVLLHLASNAGRAHYIYPVYNGKGGHPILLSPEIVSNLKKETSYNHNIKEYLGRYSKIGVNTDEESVLVNINTPSDYERVFGKKA